VKKFFLVLLLVFLSGVSAYARPACAPLSFVKDKLTVQFNEVLFATGNFESGEKLMLYVDPKSRSFSIVFTPLYAPDIGCLFQTGENFMPAYSKSNKKDRDTEK
tara:strand:+ start:3120 stop:3431 length:312 start_codon:yes stop_codon:yes gene_type:complete